MATLRTRWLVSIMMTSWCFFNKGISARPSTPDCYIPCYHNFCGADIICTWDSKTDPNDLTYTLHWKSIEGNGIGLKVTSNNQAIIQRHHFISHSELQVWVQAQNQDGIKSESEIVVLNTADIFKPPSPKITSTSQCPLEIHWSSPCDQLMFEVGHCDVQHWTEDKVACIQQNKGGVSGSYTLDNPLPSTNYYFQVRCACGTSLMSNWSDVRVIQSAEKAPVGKLDVWQDCGMLSTSSDCILIWKKLPMIQARGHILGYSFTLFYNNGTAVAFNESEAAPVGLVCVMVHCYLNTSLKDVTSVSVSAYNALGVTAPFQLDILPPVKITNKQIPEVEMKENNLTVTWTLTSWNPSIKEYVVQYKEDGSPLGIGFDWVRVVSLNNSQIKETIKGKFKKYTAYQVSVFTVLSHNKGQFFTSEIAHFIQGIPAEVSVFKVLSYGTTHVTLLWKPVLMSKQDGVTPYYHIGFDQKNVYRVNAYPQLENRTITLTNLTEDQAYEVWINGVNQAGPGPNATVKFTTLPNKNIDPLVLILGIFGIGILLLLMFLLLVFRNNKACPIALFIVYMKVPDPRNSYIIREMKHQINDSMAWLCIQMKEQHPIISVIEIVDSPLSCFNFQPENKIRNKCEDENDTLQDSLPWERNWTQQRCGKQEYSKMVDSDKKQINDEEETGNSSCSSEKENSGYEQHFMPTDIEIKEVEERERRKKDYSKMVDFNEEKCTEVVVKDSCRGPEEGYFYDYERHFMPTVLEIMET